MVPKIDQSLLIILDVGRNVANSVNKDEKSFYISAREFVARLIETKILSQANNYIGVVLLGSQNTKNNVAEQCPGEFKHIELLSALQTPSWQMIRDLPESHSKTKGDWMNALIVAADHIKNGVYGVKVMKNKIILITNFLAQTKYEHEEIQQVLDGFKTDNLEVNVIGPNIYEENNKNNDFELARQFVEETNGIAEPFGPAMSLLVFHKKKQVNIVSWNVDLSIGPDLKIPISSYIKIEDKPVVNKWTKADKNPLTSKPNSDETAPKNKVSCDSENQTQVEPESRTQGYQYGQQIIPFDKKNDHNMLYKSGERSLNIYGFTHKKNLQWQGLTDVGLSYVFGRKGDVKAQQTIKCLVECLLELELVGIARRVYNNNNSPKMYALIPNIDNENGICLSMIQLCYKESIKHMVFPPTKLKKYSCTDAQVEAFTELIKAMDLTKAYNDDFDDNEAFPIGETVNPTAQYVLDCIAYRALNPDKPLPQPREEIMTLFKVPPLVEARSQTALEKIKKLFPLKKIEQKPKKNKLQQNPQASTSSDAIKSENEPFKLPQISLLTTNNSADITNIRTVDPIEDYILLKAKGKTLSDLAPEMIDSIQSLLYYNLQEDYTKAVKTMKYFRSECVNSDPSIYNNWILKLKTTSNQNPKVLDIINEKDLNVILKSESSLSTYENEDSQLYENDTVPNTLPVDINPEVDALFDDM